MKSNEGFDALIESILTALLDVFLIVATHFTS
jgi:hypothetical protein